MGLNLAPKYLLKNSSLMIKFTVPIRNKHYQVNLHSASLCLLICISLITYILTNWQLDRAQEKIQLQAHWQAKNPIPLQQALGSNLKYKKIILSGHFDNQHPIMLDNKSFQHYIGQEILLPFLDHQSQQWVLVNLGWIPQTGPEKPKGFMPIRGKQTLDGILTPFRRPIFIHPPSKQQPLANPLLLLFIDQNTVERYSQKKLLAYTLALNPKLKIGYSRIWKNSGLSPHKHYAYAIEFFCLGLIAIGMILQQNCEKKTYEQ
jgi:surfeit locus 1 family protein